MFLTQWCLRNPVATTLFYAVVAIFGMLAFFGLGRSILPPVSFPFVAVNASYPGATPSEIERLIIEPIEDQLGGLPDVDRVSASAQYGMAVISVRFRFGADLNVARANVQQAVLAAQAFMPPDIISPIVSKDDVAQAAVLEEAISSQIEDPVTISRTVERVIVPALRASLAIGSVRVSGESARQFTVRPRSGALDSLLATPLDLLRDVAKSNDVLPGGRLRSGARELAVGIYAVAASPADIGAYPFALTRSATAVRIRDVADVREEGVEQTIRTRVDGAGAVVVWVGTAQGQAGDAAIRDARKAFAKLARRFPNFRFSELRTDQPFARAAVDGVVQTLLEGIVLTTLVVLVFLRGWRHALVAIMTIPSSLLAAFAAMQALGLTMNVLSLMGLSLTVGILVDDSIVIIEAITRAAARGLDPETAALAGRRELGSAAFAITLVDVAVFAPIALTTGIVGEFMREFGLVAVIATAFSLLVSFTLTPLLAARWALRRSGRRGGARARELPGTLRGPAVRAVYTQWSRAAAKFARVEGAIADRYADRYLPWAWRNRTIVGVLVVVACALSFGALFAGWIPSEFSPSTSRGEVTIDFVFPATTTLDHVDATLGRFTTMLLDDDRVRHVIATVGRAFNGTIDVVGSNRGQISAILTDESSAGFSILAKLKAATALAPDASMAGAGTGMGGRAPIGYTLSGDPADVTIAARRIANRLRGNPLADDVRTTDGGLEPRLYVAIDSGRALMLHVAPDDAAQTARIATGGAIATKVRLDSGLIDVVVRSGSIGEDRLQVLRRTSVRSADSVLVPLGAVADITERLEPTAIDREDRERIASVSANTRDGAPLGAITPGIATALASPGFLPSGVRIVPRGDLETFLETAARIVAALGLSAALVYAILAILYRSYAMPFVILTTVPLASVGAFGSLLAASVLHRLFPAVALFTNQTLDLYSMLGIVLLAGLVAKNGILLVDFAERRVREGGEPIAAMRESARRRFRPIVMTTVAMIAGMLPLALGETIGAEYRKALGTVVACGLASSLFLTLFVVPIAYAVVRTFAEKRFRRNARPIAPSSVLMEKSQWT